MVPHPRFREMCRRQYAAGSDYVLAPVEARDMKSHNAYFAELEEIWQSLPEEETRRFPTSEHMRARALVETGYCQERDYVCDSNSHAKHLAKIIRSHSDYSIIKISGDVVKVFEPMSQSIAAMGGSDSWKASRRAVLDYCRALIPGLDQRESRKHAATLAPPDDTEKPKRQPTTKPEIGMPTSAPAYLTYARNWIALATERDAARYRWESERDLRDRLRVSIPVRRELEELIDKIKMEKTDENV